MRVHRVRLASASATLVAVLATVAAVRADDWATVLEQARVQRRQGNLAASAESLQTAIDSLKESGAERNRAALHRELGTIRLQQRRTEEAVAEFRAALELDPESGVTHYQTGLAYRMAGDARRAADHFGQAAQLGFRTTGTLLQLTAANLATGRYSAGLHSARELIASQPRSAATLVQVGRQLFDHFFYEDALEAFEGAVGLDAASYEGRFFAALTNQLLNRHDETVRLLASAGDSGRTAEAASLLASAMAQQGRLAEAADLFRATIRRHPGSPHAYLNLAFALLERDRTDEAEKVFDQLRSLDASGSPKVFYAVQRNSCESIAQRVRSGRPPPQAPNPSRAEAYRNLARDLAGRHHHGTAIEIFELARLYEGNSARTLEALAYSCLHLDPHGGAAIQLLEQALLSEPERGTAHHLLGRAHFRQGRIEDALAAHRAATALAPDNASFLTELGRTLAAMPGDAHRDAAIGALSRAAELDSRNVMARFELGKLLASAGRGLEALRLLQEAVKLEPEFHSAYYLIGQIHMRAGQADQARAALEKFRARRAMAEARTSVSQGFADGR